MKTLTIILLFQFIFSFQDSERKLLQLDVLDTNLIPSKKDNSVKVEILFNTYNEYNALEKGELESIFSYELTRNGFEVVKEEGESVDISIQFGIVVKYDDECEKYYSVYLIEATEFTGYKFDYISGPHLNVFTNIDEVMLWLENYFIANVNTMKNLYLNE